MRQENNSKDPFIFLRAYVLPSPFTVFLQNSSLTDYYRDMSAARERKSEIKKEGEREREREKEMETATEHGLREGAGMQESRSFFTDKSASLCLRVMEGERRTEREGGGGDCMPACLPVGGLSQSQP
ncbi:hypothetical protein AALO_G00148710 [Alosa alosa]|uniref:Uncharacterized protein n=1 Tax=Alosa alosa TaxID=278164 RepID=A0AAV6GE32_9TELE|nr:hypothetical protein AALO_G00148710 [Alosa alosa]